MNITPKQALTELASLPHDQPIRPKRPQKNFVLAAKNFDEIDTMLEDIIASTQRLKPT
jgi:hypothetical protein